MSKISVIIPLYNQKEFVGRGIKSALEQSHREMEIIVVDDGSTDNPDPILSDYGSEISVIRQENRGLAGARNTGIKHARGDYVQFLDADDFLHRDKLRLQQDFMEDNDASVSYCEIAQYDQLSKKRTLSYVGELDDPFPSLYNEWFTYPFPIHSLLFKKRIFNEFGGFPEDLGASEDRFFLSLLALNGVKFNYFPFIGGCRRRHKNNMTKDRLHIYRNMVRYYTKINDYPKAKEYIKDNFVHSGHELMRANLTYMFLKDIAEGLPFSHLERIRRMLRSEGGFFLFHPIPSTRLPFKAFFLIMLAVYSRCARVKWGKITMKTV